MKAVEHELPHLAEILEVEARVRFLLSRREGQPGRDDVQLGERDTDVHAVAVAAVANHRDGYVGIDRVDIEGERKEALIPRDHAHDRVPAVGDRERVADGRLIGEELVREPVADDDGVAGGGVARLERAPLERRRAQHVEEIRARERNLGPAV